MGRRMSSDEASAGRIKLFDVVIGVVLAIVGALGKFSETEHALIATIIFAFFAVYVIIDVAVWRKYPAVWLLGPIVIAAAGYWWIGFMAKHGVPPEPILPAHLYPPQWAYFVLAGILGAYGVWDIIDAKMHRYRDEKSLMYGAIFLLVGVCICLFLTLRGPSPSAARPTADSSTSPIQQSIQVTQLSLLQQ